MSKIQTVIEAARKRNEAIEAQSSTIFARPSTPDTNAEAYSGHEKLIMGNIRRVPVNWESFNSSRILTPGMPHPAEGAYRMLRTRLMRSKRISGWQILGVSSINQNEGKTYSAINLAISIAAEVGQEAVLVELDLRRPSIYSYFGIEPHEFIGVPEYLADDSDYVLSDLLICPNIDRLGCMLAAEAIPHPSDVLASPRGRQMFDELRQQLPSETIVIVDLPPVYAADDALAVAPMLDGLLLVVAEGHTKREDLADAGQLIEEYNVIGTLLNKSKEYDSKPTYYDY